MAQSLGLLVLRAGAGGMILAGHGWEKLLSFGHHAGQFPDPLGVGSELSLVLTIVAQVLCAVFVILGVATRLSAIPLVVNMLVAAFLVHADDPWAKKELAILYAVPFLTLVFTGGGRISFDSVLWGNRRPRRVSVG